MVPPTCQPKRKVREAKAAGHHYVGFSSREAKMAR
jgi:hypothetical protein